MDPKELAAAKILVVDDNPAIAHLLERMLHGEGYLVPIASDGREALASLADSRPDLVLLDLDMPEVPGLEVCRHLKQNPATRLIPVLILTGQDDLAARLRAWSEGADDFLTKPFHNVEVLARCHSLLRIKRLVDELDSAQEVVFAFARAVEAKCPFTLGHAERVTQYTLSMATHLGLSAEEREVIRQGAILHDIGKISIPDAILNKPGPLTAAEFSLVKQHPVTGAHIVEPLKSIRATIPLIRWHHERLDGRGYPDGLMGGQIPLEARILSVADVYDALSSERPYRKALSPLACLDILDDISRDGGLDPELVQCFTTIVPNSPCQPSVAVTAR